MIRTATRRRFLKEASSRVGVLTALTRSGLAPLRAPETESRWADLPKLDGVFLLDEARREPMATDLGGHFRRLPAAVLQPRSIDDVVKIVRFANRHRLKVAMRGQGHSQYGQTLAEGGVVIDSRTLDQVRMRDPRSADACACASWNDVTHTTLAQGLTPPGMGDTMTLSVGGILSSAGVSNSSHLHGAVVDNVEELQVVTGAGDLVTCSAQRNRELFDLALGGMGQCGLIVRARLRLVPAPTSVVRRDLDYDDLDVFLTDLGTLASSPRAEHLGAYVLSKDGGWAFRINIGKFCGPASDVDWKGLEAGLRFKSHGEPVAAPYADYLQREVTRNAGLAARLKAGSRLLYITLFVPRSASRDFVAKMLATPHETAGMTRFSLYLLSPRKCARPFFVLPDEESALAIWLFRDVPLNEPATYARHIATLRGLVTRLQAVGGKIFPPYAPFYSRADWEAHYGLEKWKRLGAGKKMFDPARILTPGLFLTDESPRPL